VCVCVSQRVFQYSSAFACVIVYEFISV